MLQRYLMLIMIIIGGTFIVATAIWGIVQWRRNNAQSPISVKARVTKMDGRYSGPFIFGRSGGLNLAPHYRVTFELIPDGKKKTFEISTVDLDFGKMVAVGDIVILTLQGTRYISFKRSNKIEECSENTLEKEQ